MNHPIRILYIDDNPLDRELVRDALEKEHGGFELIETASRAGFETALAKNSFDLVLSDFNILGFEGLQVLKTAHAKDPHLPVVIVTGTGSEVIAVEVMKMGAADYVIKTLAHIQRLPLVIHAVLEKNQAEKRLRESEEKFKTLFDFANDAIFTMNHTTFLDCNATTEKVFKCSRDQIIGKSPVRFSPELQPDGSLSSKSAAEKIEAAFAGEPQLFEWLHTHLDGTPFDAEVSLNRVFIGGDFVLQAIVRDISERKRAEEAVQHSEKRFRALIENSSDAITLIDVHGVVVYDSPSAPGMLGYGPEDWIGKEMFALIHADDLSKIKSQLQDVGKMPLGGHVYSTFRVRHQKGHWLWIEAIATNLLSEPSVGAIVVNYQDITARKHSESALRKAEIKYRNLVELLPVVIYTAELGSQGKWSYVSPQIERLLGYSVEEWMADPGLWYQQTHPDDRDQQVALELQAHEKDELFETEYRMLARDGREVWVRDSGKVWHFQQSGAPIIQGLLVDITDRKQAEFELQRRQEDLEIINTLNHAANRGESLDALIDILNHETRRIYSSSACTISLLSPDGKTLTIARNAISPTIIKKIEQLIGQPLPKVEVSVREGGFIHKLLQNEKGTITSDPKLIQQWIGEYTESASISPVLRGLAKKLAPQIVKILNIGSTLSIPLILEARTIGLLELASPGLFTEDTLRRIRSISGQVTAALLHKQAEDEIRRLKDFDENLINNMSEGIVVQNTEGYITFANPATLEITGYSPDELLGAHWTKIIPVDQHYLMKEADGQRLAGKATKYEIDFLRKNEKRINMLVSGSPLFEDERFSGTIAVFIDITERRQKTRELQILSNISAALRKAESRPAMMEIILNKLLDLFNANGVILVMKDQISGESILELAKGEFSSMLGIRLPAGEGITGWVIANSQPFWSNDAKSETHFSKPELLENMNAMACIPLISKEQTIGAMLIGRVSPLSEDDIQLLTSIAEMSASAFHRAALHEQTERHLKTMVALRAMDTVIASSTDLRVTLSILLEYVINQLRLDAVAALLLNPHTFTLEYAEGKGFLTSGIKQSRLRIGEGLAGRVASERVLKHIPDLSQEQENFLRKPLLAGEKFVTHIAMPLIVKGEVKGVLELFHRTMFTPDHEWLDLFQTLAGQIAIAVDNAQLFEGIQMANFNLSIAYEATIEGWSHALDLRDKETEGHTLRVTEMTLKLARILGIQGDQLTHIRRGGLLHDIGKMGVPDAILLKPDKLTEEEWAIMKQHPQFAHDLIKPITYLKPALDIPYCHHEKWDGTGYPRGLRGEQIPLAARIFAIVDVWDAVTSDRPYRKAWSKKKARQYIKEQSGQHFDPSLAPIFLKEIDKD